MNRGALNGVGALSTVRVYPKAVPCAQSSGLGESKSVHRSAPTFSGCMQNDGSVSPSVVSDEETSKEVLELP